MMKLQVGGGSTKLPPPEPMSGAGQGNARRGFLGLRGFGV